MTKNPLALIAAVAARYLGVFETSKNRGPHIAEFWEKTNYKEGDGDRQPWCCAFVSFCVQVADAESAELKFTVPPTTASCAELVRWAHETKAKNGLIIFGPRDKEFKPAVGDLVCYRPNLSHVGIVTEDYDGSGFIETIEGNTNQEGSREGDGVYRKQRHLDFAGTFIRLPAVGRPTA